MLLSFRLLLGIFGGALFVRTALSRLRRNGVHLLAKVSIDQSVLDTPAAMAGVIFNVLCILVKLCQTV